MNKSTQAQAQQETTKTWLKLALLLVIVVCTAALIAIYICISSLKDDIHDEQQLGQDVNENITYLEKTNELADTDEGVKEVAKNELGMMDPDTIYYEFE